MPGTIPDTEGLGGEGNKVPVPREIVFVDVNEKSEPEAPRNGTQGGSVVTRNWQGRSAGAKCPRDTKGQ